MFETKTKMTGPQDSKFETTISGYSNVNTSRGFAKPIWFIFATFGGWLTFQQVSLVCEEYFTYPTETRVSTNEMRW